MALNPDLRRRLQDHFSDGVVTIVGSGYPAALGIPGMQPLADELIRAMPTRAGAATSEWESVADDLARGVSLEAALDRLPSDSTLIPEIVAVTATLIGEAESRVISEILSGAQRLSLVELIPHLAFTGNPQIVTTNYDRIIELAAELANLPLNCSFTGVHACRFDPRRSKSNLRSGIVSAGRNIQMEYQAHVRLWKPHGSLDWYLKNGEPFRTPYRTDLPRLMITPGSSKYLRGYERPFDHHREEANHAIDSAARFLTIGYGFNDAHLETHLERRITQGAPTLILARTLSNTARELLMKGSSVIGIERAAPGGTLIHVGRDQHPTPGADIWSLDSFIDEVLNGT